MLLQYLLPAAAALLPAVVNAQFVAPPTDLKSVLGAANIRVRYKAVPNGICETDPNVQSYAGYADVDTNQHIFFWFFESRNVDPTEAPLTIYLNGGPGASSLLGVFQETGPCRLDADLNVINNPFSWSNVSNMLFIDNPTQTGLSYSIPIPGYVDESTGYVIELPGNSCPDYAASTGTCGTYSYPNFTLTANSTPAAAPNVWKTVQGFMGAFPQYSRSGINLGTGSYGGHYGPVFSEYFETQNDLNIPGTKKINFENLAIYNGWYNPEIQYAAYYNYSLNNTYDLQVYPNASVQSQVYNSMYGKGNCLDQLIDCNTRGIDEICSQADNFCYGEVENVFDIITGRDEYDIRELQPDPFPPYYLVPYLNQANVQKALGAYQNFTQSDGNIGVGAVGTAFTVTGDDARIVNTVSDLKDLLKRGVHIMSYIGDADYNCNWLGNLAVSNTIDAPGFSKAGFQNLTTPDNIIHGVVKQAGNYSFLRIYNSGHQVPFYHPMTALTIFSRLIGRKDLATGKVNNSDSYLTVGPAESLYREGNSTIQLDVVSVNATYNSITNVPNEPK